MYMQRKCLLNGYSITWNVNGTTTFYVRYCNNSYKFYVPASCISVFLTSTIFNNSTQSSFKLKFLLWSWNQPWSIYPSFKIFTTHTPLTFICNWNTPLGVAVEMQLLQLENFQNPVTAGLHLSPCIGRSSQRALLLKLSPSISSMTDDIWSDGKFHNLLIQHMSSY